MSKELIDLLSQYGPAAVLLIAGGTIVAALISSVNAAVVAWFNARSARQLAIDAAHREYRREFCAPFLNIVRTVDLVAAKITDSLGRSMDSGIPMSVEDATSIAAFATEQLQSINRLGARVAPPRDATLYRALRESAKAEDTLLKALKSLDEAIATGQMQDLASHRRALVIAANYVTRATVWVDVAAEAFTFDLPKIRQEIAREMQLTGQVREP
jgi:hypothetical protein